jgi:hypothetical protein
MAPTAAPTTMAPTAAPTTTAPTTMAPSNQVFDGKPVYWNSVISFKNISSNTISILSARLTATAPGLPIPPGMEKGVNNAEFNIPSLVGDLFPGQSVSFRMPPVRDPGVFVPGQGYPSYDSLDTLELRTNPGNFFYRMYKSGTNSEYITFNYVPTKNIIVLQSN